MQPQAFVDELRWRGLLHQHTDGLEATLATGPVSGYVGFDPTAASLHVGHLVPVMGLVHLQRHGHRPVALIGGGTGMIGDPSGRSSERVLLTSDAVAANADRVGMQLGRFLDFDGRHGARLLNNVEWLAPLSAIELLRDVGKHFTVNIMLQKESVKTRLEGGISFTEFSYMLLQAYDFLQLFRHHGVRLQLGGSDQWGNITAGIELIRRTLSAEARVEAQGVTLPLVTTASGAKFGKTQAGAVWLDPELTSPYQFFQFWLGVDDRDVGRYLRYFSLSSREEIAALDDATDRSPEARMAQQSLAREMTARVHGPAAMAAAEEASRVAFGSASFSSVSPQGLEALEAEIPTFVSASLAVTDILAAAAAGPSALFKSRTDARRVWQQGGLYVNDRRLGPDCATVSPELLVHGHYLLLGKGTRHRALIRIGGSTEGTPAGGPSAT